MKIETIFKQGITPKEGDDKGKRFRVKSITPEGVDCGERIFKAGEYELWREPDTIFEDDNIPSTWGNLKKAVEAKGLPDSTPIIVSFIDRTVVREASFSLVRPLYNNEMHILID